jgi:hypothetical protein
MLFNALTPQRFISFDCELLLIVSSCKNVKKYFAIKLIISLFECSFMKAINTIFISQRLTSQAIAPIFVTIITITTIITG